jgi:WD40 repeat protein
VIHAVFVPNHTNLLAMATSTLNSLEEMDEDDKLGGLYFWNVVTNELYEVSTGFFSSNVAVSPNGQFVVVYIDKKLKVWNTEEERIILDVAMDEPSIAITDTGLIATVDEGQLTIWNLQGQPIAWLETDNWISDVAFTPDGDFLIGSYVGQDDQPIELWRLNN